MGRRWRVLEAPQDALDTRQADAVLAGHIEVQDHQIKFLVADELAHARAVFRDLHVEAVATQIAVQHEADVGVVVYDQDAG